MTKKNRQTAKTGFGGNTLWVIAALLAGSGIIRFGSGPGLAIAREVSAISDHSDEDQEAMICTTDEETSAILASLLKREAKIKVRERLLGEQQQTVSFAEKEILANIEILEQAEIDLAATIYAVETASENDLSRLTTVYENMKPKDASILFEEMAPDFAAGFVARMRPDAAAQILSGLKPTTAYSISVILAGRNARAPKE